MFSSEPGNARPWLQPMALSLTIPGFYLMLDGATAAQRLAGQALYGAAALLLALYLSHPLLRRHQRPGWRHGLPMHDMQDMQHRLPWRRVDLVLLSAIAACIWPSAPPWSDGEWAARLLVCAVVSMRMVTLAVGHVGPRALVPMCGVSLAMLAIAGGGFYWLEPQVHSFADGLWLAFTTGATVGYGDLVPSTPASKVFAVFIVLLGYALLSLVTASIAALLVGEDEKLLRRELHADMRLLLREIDVLRGEIAELRRTAVPPPS